MFFFKRETKVITQVVELPASTKLPELTGDLRETLKALQFNPAFVYLVQRLRFQKAGVETALREGIQLNETQLRFLQAGMFWLAFLEKEIASLTHTSGNTPRPATPDELELFAKIQENMSLVDA